MMNKENEAAPAFKIPFKKTAEGNPGQMAGPSQEQKQNQQEKKEPEWTQQNADKIIDAVMHSSSKVLVALAGCAAAYFIYRLYLENKQIREEFSGLKNETRSDLGELKRELRRNRMKPKKRIEDVFDVTDVEGPYVINIDEKQETKAAPSSSEAGKLDFLA